MYELPHDLIGALSPMIVVLAMMMMTGGAGGSSSYVLSGKNDDVGFLLLKARAAARKLACAHRRSGNGFVLNGGSPALPHPSGDGGGTAATPAAKARKRPREPELSLPASGAQLRYRHSERPVATGNRPWLATEATKC